MKISNLAGINNQVFLVRVNYDLPDLESVSRITDSIPTIQNLLKNQNKVVLCTHWGRPDGFDPEFSTQKILPVIQKVLGLKIQFVNQYENFEDAKIEIQSSLSQIFLLENTRFDSKEQSKDSKVRLNLAKEYAILSNFYIDEAFPVSHRNEATNTEIKELLPYTLGLSYAKEVEHLDFLKNKAKKPYILLMGGAKVETKLPVIKNLITKVDKILLGGLISLTFLEASRELGRVIPPIYDSKIYEEFLEPAKKLLQTYPEKIILPVDLAYSNLDQKPIFALDIGPQTVDLFIKNLQAASTIFWNGTMGKYEDLTFKKGTDQITKELLKLTPTAKIVVGGGDTAAAINPLDLDKFNFISMGGGATLEYLSK
jgi:phosphoglycerate kinase